MNKKQNHNAGRAMSNIPQAKNGLRNPIRNFQVLLGDQRAIQLRGNTLEIDTRKLQPSESFGHKEFLFAFNHLNEFGAEFPSSVLIHVTQKQSETHLSNGNEHITAQNEIVRFDLIQNKFR